MKKLIILIIMFTLIGCGGKTIDGESNATIKASIEEMKKGLSVREIVEFDTALTRLIANTMVTKGKTQAEFRESVDGKDIDDIIKMAEDLKSK